ncbi:family 1 glycosylhydrolase [Ruania alba]|uniref:Beta-glucosidase/6-phospho-beta-glucosidase/beta-galactosidase n=1 Tax=Ruania alba TaxID=648782 RepID=A0A1H5BCV5_9MICO|nr:family 1 glycosylhydrolase [Ruania alba]SED52433.1 Beta-glucosidase/6-phospho-beta-glucosidase/beta-galactosidase [Ruania alba]
MTWYQDGRLHFGVGVEDTFVPQTRPGERALDEYELTEHYTHWHNDLGLAAEVGAEFMRWGIPWYRINPAPGQWDWTWLDGVMARFAELGIRPIVDLLHYGTPEWLEGEFAHPDYPQRAAEYAVAVAERYADTVTDYTPVNEPMIHARFCGELGYWPPYLTGEAGLTRMIAALADGFARSQHGIAEVLGERATFVHVDATTRFVGDIDGEHADKVRLLREQVYAVEDLVTGRVHGDHPLLEHLLRHGMSEDLLDRLAATPVLPDVMGVNYYPQHSTTLVQDGPWPRGGFVDPAPTRNDGVTGLEEVILAHTERYGAPVAVTETCVTASAAERVAWLEDSVALAHRLRADGVPLVGYTWWPLFDMYEWTYRHADTPREASLLTMGLWDLVESEQGLLRRRNPVADAFQRLATADRASIG